MKKIQLNIRHNNNNVHKYTKCEGLTTQKIPSRGDRGILGHFLENELWLRFFPQIANQSVFKAVSSVPRYFLCPNLFSN